MNPTHFLVRRDDADDAPLTPTMMNLLIALVVLCAVAILSVFALFLLRRARNAKKRSELPMYNEDRSTQRMSSHHRSLTITTAPPYSNNRSSAVYVYNEKETFMNEQHTPDSPVPEIRITFPEEVDDKGNKQSGRVVVVRVGEHSVGLEPLNEEQLPPYQKDENDRFQSLDLERIGGLKEKTNEKNEYSV
ncbi:hypothetical protein SLS57_005348 [Botryosphaeria dothidea]|uniref:Uncharacterized protein n=1 Tax=Botryosphaeria dothidea TaxID=55169 RepID=A0A8H4ILZ7_9PEZI|nr:hypothetical protein GTA08_BOTSDO08248 [Botryosphaeria dothidea]